MDSFVIYLSSEEDSKSSMNAYGYYEGKTYTRDGLYFPCTTNDKEDAKVYTNKKRADTSAKKITEKCVYVLSFKIEEC